MGLNTSWTKILWYEYLWNSTLNSDLNDKNSMYLKIYDSLVQRILPYFVRSW
nr:hypothetical protein [Mycoplasmopsis bovis]